MTAITEKDQKNRDEILICTAVISHVLRSNVIYNNLAKITGFFLKVLYFMHVFNDDALHRMWGDIPKC